MSNAFTDGQFGFGTMSKVKNKSLIVASNVLMECVKIELYGYRIMYINIAFIPTNTLHDYYTIM